MRFYGIMPYDIDKVMKMDTATYMTFLKCIDVLKNREKLDFFDVSAYPYMEKNKQKELFNKVKKRGYPRIADENEEYVSSEQMARALGRALHG
jgi:3-methyladenine DNA glycosylase Tag